MVDSFKSLRNSRSKSAALEAHHAPGARDRHHVGITQLRSGESLAREPWGQNDAGQHVCLSRPFRKEKWSARWDGSNLGEMVPAYRNFARWLSPPINTPTDFGKNKGQPDQRILKGHHILPHGSKRCLETQPWSKALLTREWSGDSGNKEAMLANRMSYSPLYCVASRPLVPSLWPENIPRLAWSILVPASSRLQPSLCITTVSPPPPQAHSTHVLGKLQSETLSSLILLHFRLYLLTVPLVSLELLPEISIGRWPHTWSSARDAGVTWGIELSTPGSGGPTSLMVPSWKAQMPSVRWPGITSTAGSPPGPGAAASWGSSAMRQMHPVPQNPQPSSALPGPDSPVNIYPAGPASAKAQPPPFACSSYQKRKQLTG